MNLEFHNVTRDRWKDFERLFEGKGGPHNCWCMVWRTNENRQSFPGKLGRKMSIKRRIEEEIPIGLMAYFDNNPIAWCSIAPKDTYRHLGGDESLDDVWSLVCFFVKRKFRDSGVASKMLYAAIDYATKNGAKYLEAYPVDPESPSYRFMGFKPMFVKAGFDFKAKAGKRRNVMLLELT